MFNRLADRIQSYRTQRAHLRELSMMGDRQLADIGLNRGDIAAAVRYGRR
ncbi:DUF1127 domain-containing protein [Mangrovicella endophytica]|nr:DUF1127 domain-containing protein [Mangrovicella endophytica]